MEIKIKANEPPSLAEARMLLTWIGEYYPGLALPELEQEPTHEELVDAGELQGVQTEMEYDDETGDIIVARCGGCDSSIYSLVEGCANTDCRYNGAVPASALVGVGIAVANAREEGVYGEDD